MTTAINSRLQKISVFVQSSLVNSYQNRLEKDKIKLNRYLFNADYRWNHTLRVSQYGKVISEKEGGNLEIILAACLLHDISWFDVNTESSREHGRYGAVKARTFLETLSYSQEQVEHICYAIATHVDEDNPTTLEAKILSDADNVDRFGPYRIIQWCFADIEDYDKLASKLRERINRLEHYLDVNPLFTDTGQQLFTEQISLQIRFFSQFIGENELSIMPRI